MSARTHYRMGTGIKTEDPRLYNIAQFILQAGRIHTIMLVKLLDEGPASYIEIMQRLVGKKSSNAAYYVRMAVKSGFVVKDPRINCYALTFRGKKLVELLESLDKIVNLDMASVQDADTMISFNLKRNRTWLEPLIKAEIRGAVEELVGGK